MIDDAPFQFWVVIVAGIGFLTDAFGLFALNVVTPMLGYVYWPSTDENVVPSVPSSIKTAMMCSTLAGTMLGQIGFGFAADILGRRKMYGLELVIIIVGTMFLLMSSRGEKGSMAIGGWLITWRAIMGTCESYVTILYSMDKLAHDDKRNRHWSRLSIVCCRFRLRLPQAKGY
jgi:PHS family inorganic phosphate transporter-like MFS transporter